LRPEVYVPFAYSIVREMRRYKLTMFQSMVRVGANFIQHFLWIPLYAMIVLGDFLWGQVAYFLAAFIIIYEAGYLISDTLGPHYEKKSLRKLVYKQISPVSVFVGVVIRMVIVALLVTPWAVPYLLTIAVFLAHSLLNERFRIATFPAFTLMKGLIPFSFLLVSLGQEHILLIVAGLFGTACFETLEYYARKNLGKSEKGFLEIKNSLRRFLIILMSMSVLAVMFGIPAVYLSLALFLYAANHLVFAGLTDLKSLYLP